VHRFFGAIAVFAGWLSMGVGVAAGLSVSEVLGLNHTEGPLPPLAVYGIDDTVVLWVFVGAALLLAVPMAAAMVAEDPKRSLRPIAIGMAVTGLLLMPDRLGIAFGLPLLPGAVATWIGGELISHDADYAGPAGSSVGAPEWAPVSTSEPETGSDVAVALDPAGATVPAAAAPKSAPPRRNSRKRPSGATRICPWCSTEVGADVEACPNCHAAIGLAAAEAVLIPGVTEVSPELRRYAEAARRGKSKPNLLRMIFSDSQIPTATDAPPPSNLEALRPPSSELKAEMARMEAEIAAGTLSSGTDEATATPAGAATPAEPATPAGAAAAVAKPRRRSPRT
jgi:hypothetical protein